MPDPAVNIPDGFVELVPDVTRAFDALSDTGYTFESAVADIVDNSISHGRARVISIHLQLREGDVGSGVDFWITDDGTGMNREGLLNAMTYGAAESDDRHSLGKFGVGLKTASTTFAHRLILLSRSSANDDPWHISLDRDVVRAHNRWLYDCRPATAEEADFFVDELETLQDLGGGPDLPTGTGTLVKWEKERDILKTRAGADPQRIAPVFRGIEKRLRDHLAKVFHRFLDPEDSRERTLQIFVNGEAVEARDPFLTSRGMQPEAAFDLNVIHPPTITQPTVRVVIFPKLGEWEEVGLTRDDEDYADVSTAKQGIYLYREGRLLQDGSWLGLFTAHASLNAIRVELNATSDLDEFLSLDIKKSQVRPSAEFMTELEKALTPFVRGAAQRSKQRNSARGGQPGGGPTEATIDRLGDQLTGPSVQHGQGQQLVMTTNSGAHTLRDEAGATVEDLVRIVPATGPDDELRVVHVRDVQWGALWEPALVEGTQKTQVRLNMEHSWYQKAYEPVAGDSDLSQALEFLLFAVAQAELNNTRPDLVDVYEEFRVEVSRNLHRLVAHLHPA